MNTTSRSIARTHILDTHHYAVMSREEYLATKTPEQVTPIAALREAHREAFGATPTANWYVIGGGFADSMGGEGFATAKEALEAFADRCEDVVEGHDHLDGDSSYGWVQNYADAARAARRDADA